ncbi:OmpA family protein [Flavobacterium sp. K5-23]|uniref:OmpA family protein n=1 Tax=Flavobacterium sp. K5-23 TaxID=2746225 RepID=UPI00200FBC49|nr:OmpA family protein [Flavobacterium sp. K5-23]UQD56375.1 OmpA family protein [Flavobacterium sp. K5-23]
MRVRICLVFLFFNLISVSGQEKLELFFDFNRDVINEKSNLDFNNWLVKSKDKEVLKIYGYCDSVDTNLYNKELSSRRANNVLSLIRFNNVQLSKDFEINGYGEDFEPSKVLSENRKVVIYYVEKLKSKDNETNGVNVLIVQKRQKDNPLISSLDTENSLKNEISKAKAGDLIRLENLNFHFNSEKITERSEPILLNLLGILKSNPKLNIEIHGHICCNNNPNDVKLSYRRSKFVFDYLIKNGIATARLGHRGFGSTRPIYALPEKNEEERLKNRRVEIKIMKK